MKRLGFVLAFMLAASVATAQSYVRPELFLDADGVTPQLNLWLHANFNEGRSRHGVWFWGILGDGFAEGLGGYSVYLNRSVQVGLGLGPSSEPGVTRWSPFLWVGRGRVSTFLAFEDGAGDPWYMLQSGVQFTETVSAGLLVRKYVGVGPFLQVKTGSKKEYAFLVFAGADEGTLKAMVSVQRDF